MALKEFICEEECSCEAQSENIWAKQNNKIDRMHIVYILISQKDPNRYYIGLTDNLEKRIKKHNTSQSYYSKRYAPWYIETYITFKNKLLAQECERYLKSGSGHAFLKKRLIP